MCEVPYSVAAPVEQLVSAHHGISYPQQPDAVSSVCWQQQPQVIANGSSCDDGGYRWKARKASKCPVAEVTLDVRLMLGGDDLDMCCHA